jgi:chloramphenicol 3-O-phosphotransferase
MNPIFLLIGPPAVGKSTTSKALAAKFKKSIHIPVDDFLLMVISGLVLPSLPWSEALIQQVTLARETAIQMALNYQRAGFAVVIDDFLDPKELLEYQTLFNQTPVHRIVLYPSQNEAHNRNVKRAAGDISWRDGMDVGIEFVYQQLRVMAKNLEQAGWLILDTTELSVEEVVSEILRWSSIPDPQSEISDPIPRDHL